MSLGADAPDPYDQFFDYYETVIGRCTVDGCGWETPIDWSDLGSDNDEPPEARRVYAEHYASEHRSVDEGS